MNTNNERLKKGVMFSSNKQDWETPRWIFDKYNEQFNFTLDAAASKKNHLCEKYYTEKNSAFNYEWSGETVWCNPPYNNIKRWYAKCYGEAQKDGVTVVMLVPAKTDTKYFHEYVWDTDKHKPKEGNEVHFLKGRIRFSNCKDNAPFPSMIVIMRGEDLFRNKVEESYKQLELL